MMVFKKSRLMSSAFDSYVKKLSDIYNSLSKYSDIIDVSRIKQLQKNFLMKTQDFFSQDKKLNIAVLGQVKAGKSAFINALIFDGKEILPSDAAPKTANLTRIEYSSKNQLIIEYYNKDEWDAILKLSQSMDGSPAVKSARGLVDTVVSLGIDPFEKLSDEAEIISFRDYDELLNRLDNYVGKSGRYTPLVKLVTINLNKEELKYISLVDTPGLNDPIVSRTEKTRQCIEKCDAAFFLSRSSYFMDKTDSDLLTAQLPQKGVKKLILVASQFDSGLMDCIYDYDSIDEAKTETKALLRRHTIDCIDKVKLTLQKQHQNDYVYSLIENCKRPVFISVMANAMSRISADLYTDQQKTIYKVLSQNDNNISAEELREIGNLGEIQAIFDQIVKEKDSLLSDKAKSFIVIAESELAQIFKDYKQQIELKMSEIRDVQIKMLTDSKQENLALMNRVKSEINKCFSDYTESAEKDFTCALSAFEGFKRQFTLPSVNKEINIKNTVSTVSDSKFFIPWTWGKTHNEYSTTKTTTNYIDPQDFCEGLLSLSDCAKQVQSLAFSCFEDISSLKKSVFVILDKYYFSISDGKDYVKVRKKLEDGLKYIKITVSAFDVSPYIERVKQKYPNRIIADLEQKEFTDFCNNMTEAMISKMYTKFYEDKESFKNTILKIQSDVCAIMLKSQTKKITDTVAEISHNIRIQGRMAETLEVINNYY